LNFIPFRKLNRGQNKTNERIKNHKKLLDVFSGKTQQFAKNSKESAFFRPMSPAQLRIDFGPTSKTINLDNEK